MIRESGDDFETKSSLGAQLGGGQRVISGREVYGSCVMSIED
jgi:hypothetical protein